MHFIYHALGMDSPNSPVYLFLSGACGVMVGVGGGLLGYYKLKHHHRRHIDALHTHIDELMVAQNANRTEGNVN